MASQKDMLFNSCTIVFSDNVFAHDKLLWKRIMLLGFSMKLVESHVTISKKSAPVSDIEQLLGKIKDAYKPKNECGSLQYGVDDSEGQDDSQETSSDADSGDMFAYAQVDSEDEYEAQEYEDHEDDRSRSPETTERECGVCCHKNVVYDSLTCCDGDICCSCKKKWQSCPFCETPFKRVTGNQPRGTMDIRLSKKLQLKGYERHGSYEILYFFPSGAQQSNHPEPGKQYDADWRNAYLPASSKGHKVLRLLRLAFLRRLTFTIGVSQTTGRSGVIVWNNILHKTSLTEGSLYGYPDSNYLKSVTKDLEAKGVTESGMTEEEMRDLAKLENDLKIHKRFKDNLKV